MSATGNPASGQTGAPEPPESSGPAPSSSAATAVVSGDLMAELADSWASAGDSDRLAGFFALAPDNPAAAFAVYGDDEDTPQVFGQPIAAWTAFRECGPGARLLAVGDALNRKIAVIRLDGVTEFVPVDQESVTGAGAPEALRAWREHPLDAAEPDGEAEPAPETPAEGGASRGMGLWRLGYAMLGLVALVLAFLFFRVTIDDSFITWRYGENLVEHGVWGWNADGPPVEGYSNPLYAFLSIIPALLGMSAELFFKIVSVALAVGYVVVVRRAGLPRVQEFVLLAVALASPIFFLQLFMGLETASFALLIGWLYAIVYRRGGLGRTGFAVAAAVALSRPEGIVLAAVAIGWSLLIDRSRGNRRGAIAVLAGWAVYWGARWWYFGSFFPNPYYKKVAGDIPLPTKILDAMPVVGPILLPIVLGLAMGVALYRRSAKTSILERPDLLRDAVPVLLAVTSAAVVLGLYRQSMLVMDPGHRFYWQLLFPVVLVVLSRRIRLTGPRELDRSALLALIAVAVAAGTAVAWDPGNLTTDVWVGAGIVAIALYAGGVRKIAGAALLGAIGLAAVLGFGNSAETTNLLAYRYRIMAHQEVGETIRATKLPDGAIAIGDSGVLPYEADRSTIDLGGLASRESSAGSLSPEWLRSRNLQLAVMLSGSDDAGSAWTGGASTSVLDYVRDPRNGFWSANGAVAGPGYYLNYWIGPQWQKTPLSDRLGTVFMRTKAQNDKPDAQVFLDNLWNFSFLTK
ncbi:hypothetical protein [Amycolatopsis sp. WGS_07]|uniref:hypothetical protein n=1 Tax=Amycolatopsis sp. WGS_07 TaxID=3076764 RepID=UPI0038739FBF